MFYVEVDPIANGLKALRLANIPHRGCMGHSIQTMMQNALGTIKTKNLALCKNPQALDLAKKNKQMITKVHCSTKNNKLGSPLNHKVPFMIQESRGGGNPSQQPTTGGASLKACAPH